MKLRLILAFVLLPAVLAAQNAPLTGTTIKSTSTSVSSLCVGCALGSTTPVANSAAKVATLFIEPLSTPLSVTSKLYNVSGVLTWAAGFESTYSKYASAVSPTANGTIQRATVTGLTTLGVAGSTYDWSVYTPSGASVVMGNVTGTQTVVFGGSTGFGANIADLNTTPTITSGFGASATIAGKAYAFKVSIVTGGTNDGIVAFNGTYANAPICVASGSDMVHITVVLASSTTTVELFSSGAGWDAGTVITVLCRGY